MSNYKILIVIPALALLSSGACGSSSSSSDTDAGQTPDATVTPNADAAPSPDAGNCPGGFTDTNGDGSVCTNIDECTVGTDNCDANATCSDTEGSFTCACNIGFSGNGTTCIADGGDTTMSFFVAAESPSATGSGSFARNDGSVGLAAADSLCSELALGVDATDTRTWHAYLSTEGAAGTGDDVHARDRIGTGPWYNADQELFAVNLDAIHTIQTAVIECPGSPAACISARDAYIAAKPADALFLDQDGVQVTDPLNALHLPVPNGGTRGHDIMTGSNPDGTVATGLTCNDWTSNSGALAAIVGHTDVPGNPAFSPSWNSGHETVDCSADGIRQRGGAAFIYCFVDNQAQ